MPSPIDSVKLKPEHDRRRKLTVDQINEIRALVDSGASPYDLAPNYGVSVNTIYYHTSETCYQGERARQSAYSKTRAKRDRAKYVRELRAYKKKLYL